MSERAHLEEDGEGECSEETLLERGSEEDVGTLWREGELETIQPSM